MKTLPRSLFATFLMFAGSLSGCDNASNESSDNPPGQAQLPAQCSTLQSTGVAPGQVAPGITLRDGDGRAFNPQQFCDKTILLIAGSMF